MVTCGFLRSGSRWGGGRWVPRRMQWGSTWSSLEEGLKHTRTHTQTHTRHTHSWRYRISHRFSQFLLRLPAIVSLYLLYYSAYAFMQSFPQWIFFVDMFRRRSGSGLLLKDADIGIQTQNHFCWEWNTQDYISVRLLSPILAAYLQVTPSMVPDPRPASQHCVSEFTVSRFG